MKSFSIAIDGPVAAGKGTIAPKLAKKIGGFYLYTGGTYRSLALYALEQKVDIYNPREVIDLLGKARIELVEEKVFLNGKDITYRIKEQDVANAVSVISSYKDVREAMTKRQREIAEEIMREKKGVVSEVKEYGYSLKSGKAVVAEGRDTATVLFPDADFKLFLTAPSEVRAKRRMEQFREYGYTDVSYEQVLEQIKKRDLEDSERNVDPLVKDPEKYGYFILDNSELTEEQTIDVIIKELKKRGLLND